MASFEQTQDEGYSEDPLTVSTGSMARPATLPPLAWLANVSVADRTQYVMSIIDRLPTSEVCEIVTRVRPRLYIDFFKYLPPEVCLKILGFLDPKALINTARASREWMQLALDRKLWEQLYYLEGFRVITSEVRRFEEMLNAEDSGSNFHYDIERASKKRATPQRFLSPSNSDVDYEMVDSGSPGPSQGSLFGRPFEKKQESIVAKLDEDDIMADLYSSSRQQTPKGSRSSTRPMTLDRTDRGKQRQSSATTHPRLSDMSSLITMDRMDNKKKLNWQYLYSQRRRLEANWEAEKYTNFQLPHPNHPEEAHEECIYTIQHSGKYLVSGSRDKTLRIWDLDTRRLIRTPLRAHTGSVLCLQFDADPEEDLIVSGSSDATIVLWKFSTGQIIQRLRKAHNESVLNVKFDKRVLVTCSKDKTIKIFNRKPIGPGDLGYPDLFQGVNSVPTYLNNYGFHPTPTADLAIRQPYSMIGTLEGHGAAVNAVQIFGDEVVSASGDRTVKVWNWPEQICTRTLIGHTKGIACVQYDGLRIVSGSSDNEVKVFDKESGLEVASLRAHTNLVRTVQAGFGDLPYSAEEDKEDAKIVDLEYFKALEQGSISRTLPKRGRPRNAGSRKPEDITAYGAKLPPGGGGGKFGRIVSGSYDETIIIWRRDKEGVWKAQHTLRQEEAAHAASRNAQRRQAPRLTSSPEQTPAAGPSIPAEPAAQVQGPFADTSLDVDAPTTPFTPGSQAYINHIIDSAIPNGPDSVRQMLVAHPEVLTVGRPHLSATMNSLLPATRIIMSGIVNSALQSMIQQGEVDSGLTPPVAAAGPSNQSAQASAQAQGSLNSQTSIVQPPVAPAHSSSTPVPNSGQNPTATTAPQASTFPVPTGTATAAAPAPNPHHHLPHHHLHPASMARVFKLQFDARRIICCSQTAVIVGWDFANGDEQIIDASRFFAPIE